MHSSIVLTLPLAPPKQFLLKLFVEPGSFRARRLGALRHLVLALRMRRHNGCPLKLRSPYAPKRHPISCGFRRSSMSWTGGGIHKLYPSIATTDRKRRQPIPQKKTPRTNCLDFARSRVIATVVPELTSQPSCRCGKENADSGYIGRGTRNHCQGSRPARSISGMVLSSPGLFICAREEVPCPISPARLVGDSPLPRQKHAAFATLSPPAYAARGLSGKTL